jgi:hypothetical protein
MAASLGVSQLWDIRQPVMTLAEDSIRIRYQEITTEDTQKTYVCCSYSDLLECVNQWGCYRHM